MSQGPLKRHSSKVPGSGEFARRSLSLLVDDPQLNDALKGERGAGGRESDSLYRIGEGDEAESADLRLSHCSPHNLEQRTSSFIDNIDRTDIAAMSKRSGNVHLQSADLLDNYSPFQKERQVSQLTLADYLGGHVTACLEATIQGLIPQDQAEVRAHCPHICDLKPVAFYPQTESLDLQQALKSRRPLKVGMVLSGGPAPGGHNVIAGVYDKLKAVHPESKLLGFMGGLDGFFTQEYIVVDDELMNRFRNTGGFDMFWSGRGKVGPNDREHAKTVVEGLELNGLIIVGGDGSNSNAALLAEYFASQGVQCAVVGVPKTIDGDLKNAAIECSFGFDTAAKTYAELVGNLCTDACSGQGVWHMVRIMGRLASHLVFEVALQTRPNAAYISEEVEAENTSLDAIVSDITNLIIERYDAGKQHGVVLIPEGLIGFIPEMKVLIDEMSTILIADPSNEFDERQLTSKSLALWESLPDNIQMQLLGAREATGYVQVAKIATERFMIQLVEEKLASMDWNPAKVNFMHHYFGYEGRCAMPSVFDSNYCYNLGFTAGTLVEHKKNGYMAVVKDLAQDASMWTPMGVPFVLLMKMIDLPAGRIPGIARSLVDVESTTFKVFKKVRKEWRIGDYYRCPGPIQFDGPVAAISNYVVLPPKAEDLLAGTDESLQNFSSLRAHVPKRVGCYSPLQLWRLKYRPQIPPLCTNPDATCVPASQYLPKDPYVRRQIMLYASDLCRDNQFSLQEVQAKISDALPEGKGSGLRIGVLFVSRQSPGMNNILWGVHERVSLMGGTCLGFIRGVQGLLDKNYIEIEDEDLEPYKNLGGIDILGRGVEHKLLDKHVQDKVIEVVRELSLDGLIMIGSSLAMTEAAFLTERMLNKKCRCRVIGVPATASNNVLNDLIEANVGFDTASKLYSSLIGNVLSDAASMPKYWHFIRLMGRQHSNEILECALQTHPNVVIIAEEYGAAQKTLSDVVSDIADAVCDRADVSKREKKPRNFGCVLIPEGLWHHIPNLRLMLREVDSIIRTAEASGQLDDARNQLLSMTAAKSPMQQQQCETPIAQSDSDWAGRLTPWSRAVWCSMPAFIQDELLVTDREMRDSFVETETLLSQLVRIELNKRAAENRYRGTFQSTSHYFGYQGRSAMPSNFDASLGLTHGYLAAICVESGLTGYLTTVRGLCSETSCWKLGAIPFNSMLTIVPTEQDYQIHPQLASSRKTEAEKPLIPNAEVNLQSKALRWMRFARGRWMYQDRFCNPGPIQFWGAASHFYHRILHECQAEYSSMVRHVQKYAQILHDACDFGVDEEFLKMAYVSLQGLLTLRFHPDDVMKRLGTIPQTQDNADSAQDDGEGRLRSGPYKPALPDRLPSRSDWKTSFIC